MFKRRVARIATVSAIVSMMMLLLGTGLGQAAQTEDSKSHTVTFDNKAAVRLTLNETTYDFGEVDPVASPFFSPDNAVNPNVRCNSNWTLSVRGVGDFHSGTYTIPLSRLSWRANGSGGYTTMTTADATVATGSKTGNAGVTTAMGYRLEITFDDDPADDYSTTIIYTATTP